MYPSEHVITIGMYINYILKVSYVSTKGKLIYIFIFLNVTYVAITDT